MSRTTDIVVALTTAQSPASGNPYHTEKGNNFQDYTKFDEEFSIAAGTPTAIDFTNGNKQVITGTPAAINLTAPGVGTYLLRIPDNSGVTSIVGSSGTTVWLGPVPTWTASKLAGIACHFDGTNWTLNGSIEE